MLPIILVTDIELQSLDKLYDHKENQQDLSNSLSTKLSKMLSGTVMLQLRNCEAIPATAKMWV